MTKSLLDRLKGLLTPTRPTQEDTPSPPTPPKKAKKRLPASGPPAWLEAGQRVMLNTVGAVEVSEMTARRVTLRAGKESWRFATHELAGVVRPVASDVDAVLRSLGEAAPDERSVNERTFDYSQLIDSGSFAERARAYAELRRDEQKVMGGEHYRWKLKELVVGEIAAAKGTTQRKSAALLAQTLDPTAVVAPDRTQEIRGHTLPEFEDYPAIGAMAIEREIAVGEGKPAWSAEAVPGVWYVYCQPERYDPSEMVAMHHEAVFDAFSDPDGWTEVGEASIEGASMMIGDKAAMLDEDFLRECFWAGGGIIGQRAALTKCAGDGACRVLVTAERRFARCAWCSEAILRGEARRGPQAPARSGSMRLGLRPILLRDCEPSCARSSGASKGSTTSSKSP